MATLRLVRVVDMAAERATDEFWMPSLQPMQFAVVEVRGNPTARMLADRQTRRLVIAALNDGGGACDHCKDFGSDDILTCAIYEVVP